MNCNVCIEVKNLQKKYRKNSQDELTVLDDISFKIDKKEVVCIIGRSGCGKSTLLRLMAGLDTDYDGQIFIDDELVLKPSKKRGFVYQEPRLFPWLTISQNIEFVINDATAEEKKKRVKEVLELVGLKDSADLFPKMLSGGMAQRVNIARALVNAPEILFFDEPFGSLDALTKMQLQGELLKIRTKMQNTMLIVTHDIDEAIYLSDRIIVLGGSPANILSVVDVDLGENRDRTSLEFVKIKKKLYEFLGCK